MSKKALKDAIAAVNTGQRFPVVSLVRQDPGLAAVISKLVPDRINSPTYGLDGNRTTMVPDYGALKSISEHTAQSRADAQTVLQILPDMELSAQILISSILAPKDMTTTELTFSHSEGFLPPEVSGALIARTKTYFEQDYKIEPLLPKMLRDILFEAGSYSIAVIPENAVDDAINGSARVTMESLSSDLNADGTIRPSGLLGPVIRPAPAVEKKRPGLSLESFNDIDKSRNIDGLVRFELGFGKPVEDSYLTVSDNVNLLKIPLIYQKIREGRIHSLVGSRAMESLDTTMTDRELSSKLYKDKGFTYQPITSIKSQEQLTRHSVGNPLIMRLPAESVIPVHVPGAVEEQIGFFILVDGEGNPVSKESSPDYYQELQSRLNQNGSFPSAMLNKVKSMTNGFDIGNQTHLDFSARAYGQLVEQDLLARLRNGVYGAGAAIAKKEDVYRIMLSRALGKQHTQLLFVPASYMTYFAFRFHENGVGKSLLDDMQILNSLRSMLTFANVMAALKNSIGRTEVKLKLDEADPDPKKTIEIAMHEIARTRQQYFPLGMNSPTDLVDWLQRSGFEFSFEGHPGIPDVSVDFGEKNSNYTKPDSELEESLRKRAIMAVGLSPEMVDNSFSAEFATTVVSNNLLLSKRVMTIQEQFTPQLSDHMRKVMMNSEKLIDELRSIVVSNYDKLDIKDVMIDAKGRGANTDALKEHVVRHVIKKFIMSFEVALPRPNSVTLENQLDALKIYSEALDVTLESWLSDKFFNSDTGGEVSNQTEAVREMMKAYFIRQWMSENGMMPELSDLTATDKDGKPVLDLYAAQKSHIEALTKSMTSLMVGLQQVKNASDMVLDDRVGETEPPAAPTDGEDAGGSGGGDDNPFGDDSGDDFGLDDMGSAPAADAPAQNEKPKTVEPPAEPEPEA